MINTFARIFNFLWQLFLISASVVGELSHFLMSDLSDVSILGPSDGSPDGQDLHPPLNELFSEG
jgi:hypothetical protein